MEDFGTRTQYPVLNRAPVEFSYEGSITRADLVIGQTIISSIRFDEDVTNKPLHFLGDHVLRADLIKNQIAVHLYSHEKPPALLISEVPAPLLSKPIVYLDGMAKKARIEYNDGEIDIYLL